MLKSITSIATVYLYGCSSIDFKEDTIQNSGNSVMFNKPLVKIVSIY